eukprot:6158286-Prorocentrum_lima.AAC.1
MAVKTEGEQRQQQGTSTRPGGDQCVRGGSRGGAETPGIGRPETRHRMVDDAALPDASEVEIAAEAMAVKEEKQRQQPEETGGAWKDPLVWRGDDGRVPVWPRRWGGRRGAARHCQAPAWADGGHWAP